MYHCRGGYYPPALSCGEAALTKGFSSGRSCREATDEVYLTQSNSSSTTIVVLRSEAEEFPRRGRLQIERLCRRIRRAILELPLR